MYFNQIRIQLGGETALISIQGGQILQESSDKSLKPLANDKVRNNIQYFHFRSLVNFRSIVIFGLLSFSIHRHFRYIVNFNPPSFSANRRKRSINIFGQPSFSINLNFRSINVNGQSILNFENFRKHFHEITFSFRIFKLEVGKFENHLASARLNLEMKSNWFWLRPMRLLDLKLSLMIMVPKLKVWLVNFYLEHCCFPMMRRLYWMATKSFQLLKIKMEIVITLMITQWNFWEEDITIISTKSPLNGARLPRNGARLPPDGAKLLPCRHPMAIRHRMATNFT